MGLSLSNLESELLEHLGVESTDFTNGMTDVDLLLNRSYWKVLSEYKFKEKETTTIISTVDGTSSYNLATLISPIIFDALQSVSIEDPINFNHTTLDEMKFQEYQDNFINSTDEEDKPTRYIRDGQNGNIIFYRTPDQVYSVTLNYWQILSDIQSSGPVIPKEWHEVVLFGAVYRGFYRFGDYNRGDKATKVYNKLISESTPVEVKEKSNIPHAGLTVLGNDY